MQTNSSLRARPSAFRALAFFLGLCLALMAALGGRSVLFAGKLKRIASTGGQGYWLLARDGGVFAFGDAPFLGANPNSGNDIIGLAPSGARDGYWTADDDGTVFEYGKAKDLGDRGGSADDLAGFAARPQGDGYWFVSRGGEVFAKGAAAKLGEPATINGVRSLLPNANRAVGIVSSPSGNGYWVIARDGGVFTYGDASFFGSTGDIKLNQPIVGLAASPTGSGYWFVAADGGVFTYGPGVAFHGSLGGNPPAGGISGIAATASGKGYWLVGANGKVYPFGDAGAYGDLSGVALNQPVIGIVPTPVVKTVDPQIDHLPAAADDSGSVDEDGSGTFGVLANDSELQDAPVRVTVSGPPAHGSTLVADNAITYTPNSDYNGSDSLTYTVTDADGDTATAKLSLTVANINDAPKASGASVSTDEDVAYSGSVSGSDADNDVLTYSVVSGPAHGELALEANGSYQYTPAAGYVGNDSFTYKANDGQVDSAPATVTIIVAHVNHAPSIVLDETVGAEGVTVAEDDAGIKVPFTATDPDKDDAELLTVTARVVEQNKAFGLEAAPVSELVKSLEVTDENGERFLTIVPNPNQNGTTTIELEVTDPGSSSATAMFQFTVDPVDDQVTATNDAFEVAEDSTDSDLAVAANDNAVDNPILVEILDGPDHGTATVNSDGTVHYVPAADYPNTLASAADSFVYRVTDADGDNGVATANITVTQVNDAPEFVSVPGDQTVAEDGTTSDLTVTFTDKDSPLGSLSYDFGSDDETLVTDDGFTLVGGSLASGSVTFNVTPVKDANGGPVTITGTITDDGGLSDTASFELSVTPVNDAPTIAAIANQTMDEDTTIDVPVTVADIDTDLGAVMVTGATSTNPALLPDGSLTVTRGETDGTWNLHVTPAADGNGTATIQVAATDDDGGIAQPTASFVLTVDKVDDVVAANDDTESFEQNTGAHTIDVLANDENLGDGGIEVTLLNAPAAGFTAVVNSDNTIGFTAPAGFAGVVEFGYELLDADNDHDTAKVTVNVTDVASSPVISAGQASETNEDTPSAPMSFTISDPDTSTFDLEMSATSSDESIVAADGFAFSGEGPNRMLVVTPVADANGPVTITVKVGDGTTFGITDFVLDVKPVDDQPAAGDDSASTDEDTAIEAIDVLGNDVLGNDPKVGDQPVVVSTSSCPPGPLGCVPCVDLSCILLCISQPETCPMFLGLQGTQGDVTVNPDNTLKYTPPADFSGTDTVWYTVTDGNGSTAWSWVTVEVNSVDDQPVAVADSATVLEDGSTDINVLGGTSGGSISTFTADPEGNDTGIGDTPVTVTIVTPPGHGTATVNEDSTIHYVPAAEYNGEDTLRYRVTDLDGDFSEADVFINVESVDDTPVAVADEAGTTEDHPVTFGVLGNDSGFGDGGIKVTIAVPAGAGEATVNEDNTITYTPAADKWGEDSFDYLVTDADGSKDQATVTVSVESVDDVPVAQDDSLTMAEDGEAQSINVLGNDSGLGDGGLVVTVLGEGPANGTVEVNGTSVSYTPDADFNGADTFSYQVEDADGDIDEGDVSITVSAVNDAPVATDDAVEVAENATSATVDVLGNDSDVDNTKAQLKVIITGLPSVPGQLNCSGDGICTYTPEGEGGITGPVTFTYQVKDPAGASDSGTVTIDIPAPQAPVIGEGSSVLDGINSAIPNQSAVGTIQATGDGELTYELKTQPAYGTVNLVGSTWTYDYGYSAPDGVGTDHFTITVKSSNGLSTDVEVTINIFIGEL